LPASGFSYGPSSRPGPASFTLEDAPAAADEPLNAGTLQVVLEGMPDEIQYRGDNVAQVLNDGIEVAYAAHGNAPVKLEVLKFRIRNLRSNGFSPYHTFTMFSAELVAGGKPRRITSFFKNSKRPYPDHSHRSR